MAYFLLCLVIATFLVFVNKVTDIPYKIIIPLAFMLFLVSISFSRLTIDELSVEFEEDFIPFGSVSTLDKSFEIQEKEKNLGLATKISYDYYGVYESQFRVPTKDILNNEKIIINITLDKNYVGDYEIYLPQIGEKNVVEISSFESEAKNDAENYFKLDAENRIGDLISKIIIKQNTNDKVEKSFSIGLLVTLEDSDYNKITTKGIKIFERKDFQISFQNSLTDHQKIRIIVNEDEEPEKKVDYSIRVISNENNLGLNLGVIMKYFTEESYGYDEYETFLVDKNDDFVGFLKPLSKNTKYKYVELEKNKKMIFSEIDTKQAYYIELENKYPSIIEDDKQPYFFMIVTRGGYIDIGNSKHTDFGENYASLMLNTGIPIALKVTSEYASNFEKKTYKLHTKNKDNSIGNYTGLNFDLDREGRIKNNNYRIKDNSFLNDYEKSVFYEKNLFLIPRTNEKKDYYLVDSSDNIKFPVLEILGINNENLNLELRYLSKKDNHKNNYIIRKIFYNKVEDKENYLKLYDITLNID